MTDGTGSRVPAADVFPILAQADLIKMDIEGSEWPILSDPRFAALPAAAIALECHPDGCPQPDYVGAARDLLIRAGFEVIAIPNGPPGAAMMWGWKRTATQATAREDVVVVVGPVHAP